MDQQVKDQKSYAAIKDEAKGEIKTKTLILGCYSVKPELSQILEAIIEKHGDIAKDCLLESEAICNFVLETITQVVKEVRQTPLENVCFNQFDSWICVLNDAERVKMNVTWLREGLEHTMKHIEKIECIERTILLKNSEIAKIRSEIRMLEIDKSIFSNLGVYSHQGLNMTNDPHGISEAPSTRPRESHSIPQTANHSEEESIRSFNSLSTCQCKDQRPNMKAEDKDIMDTITVPSSVGVLAMANSVTKAIAEIEEINPANATTEQVGFYTVNSTFTPVLEAIINKHGDIAKECHLVSGFMQISILEGICKVVNELQCKQLTDLENCHFYTYFSIVKDAEAMKLNVKWLGQRLDELWDASKSMKEANNLRNESRDGTARIEHLKKALQIKKVEMERLRSEIEESEFQLALETVHTDKLNTAIGNLAMKYQLFVSKSLTDGLL